MPDDATPHHVSDSDMAGITEPFFLGGQGEDGSAHIGVDRAGVDRRVASADVSADGRVTDRIEGGATYPGSF
jgi:hypothetical protein